MLLRMQHLVKTESQEAPAYIWVSDITSTIVETVQIKSRFLHPSHEVSLPNVPIADALSPSRPFL